MRLLGVCGSLFLAHAAGACSTASDDGGSASDFQTCETDGDCDGGSCIRRRCETSAPPEGDIDAADAADCRTLGCGAPFECALQQELGTYACGSEGAGIPECRGTPPGSPLGLEEASDGIPLHHVLLDQCLVVTYGPGMDQAESKLSAAIDTLNAVDCSRLCFELGGLADAAPDALLGERRIHVTDAAPIGTNDYLLSTVTFEKSTGRIMSCVVDGAADRVSSLGIGDYMASLMLCSGFVNTPGTSSVTESLGQPGLAPSALPDDDVASLCAVYGSPAHCASEDERFR